jgi:hypothetical protein
MSHGQKRSVKWEQFRPIAQLWILIPTITHPHGKCTLTPRALASPVRQSSRQGTGREATRKGAFHGDLSS